jgi:hypothetical protein
MADDVADSHGMGPGTPVELLALDLASLVGRPVAEAKARVEAAGGRLRAVGPNDAVTLDYRGDRVTVLVIDDEVLDVTGIG